MRPHVELPTILEVFVTPATALRVHILVAMYPE